MRNKSPLGFNVPNRDPIQVQFGLSLGQNRGSNVLSWQRKVTIFVGKFTIQASLVKQF